MAKKKTCFDEMKYEQAYSELESAVAMLESGNTTIDEALDKFEIGMRAARQCVKLLDAAESKMIFLINEANVAINVETLEQE